MSIFPNLIVTFNTIPTKITVRYFVFIDMNSKVYVEKQKTYKSQYMLKKRNKVVGLTQSNFKTYY